MIKHPKSMEQKIIIDNDYITIYKLGNVFKLVWKSSSEMLEEKQYKELILLWANIVLEQKPQAVLVDTREHLVTISIELQTWFVDVIFPKYEASGMKKLAFIMSSDFISQLSIEQTMEEDTSVGFKNQYFASEEEGLTWIQS